MTPTIELGEFAVKRGGSVDPSKHPEETFQLFSIPAYDTGEAEIALGSQIGSSKKCVEPGDVLLSRIVPHIRRCWIVGPMVQHRQIASGEWISFRGDDFHPPYLRHFLMSDPFHAQFMQTVSGVGGSLLRARPAEVYKIKLPLPPLPEQKRIAKILDAADGLRAKRRESLAQLDALLQSTFLDMFGDGKKNPNAWPTTPIGSVVTDFRGGANLRPEDFSPQGFPVLHKGAIKPKGVVELDGGKKTFADSAYAQAKQNSVVTSAHTVVTLRDLVPTGPSIGLAADLASADYKEYLLAQGAYGFRLDSRKIHPAYFVALSNDTGFRTELRRFAVGSTQIHVRVPVYKEIRIPVPPIALQQQFAELVTSVQGQKARYSTHLQTLDALSVSLQSRAFRNQL